MSGIEFTPFLYALPIAVAMFSTNDRHVHTTLLGLELGPSRALQQQDRTTRRNIFQQWTEVDQQQGQRPTRVKHDDESSLEASMEVTIGGMPFPQEE
jgi:hypothetical protein